MPAEQGSRSPWNRLARLCACVRIPLLVALTGLLPAPRASASPDGIAHLGYPTAVRAADPEGRWVILCQATSDTNHDGAIGFGYDYHGNPRGDEVAPYLEIGVGTRIPIDEFVSCDPTGRYVAVIRSGSLHLLDAETARFVDLG